MLFDLRPAGFIEAGLGFIPSLDGLCVLAAVAPPTCGHDIRRLVQPASSESQNVLDLKFVCAAAIGAGVTKQRKALCPLL